VAPYVVRLRQQREIEAKSAVCSQQFVVGSLHSAVCIRQFVVSSQQRYPSFGVCHSERSEEPAFFFTVFADNLG
jgi:hypothetical protein